MTLIPPPSPKNPLSTCESLEPECDIIEYFKKYIRNFKTKLMSNCTRMSDQSHQDSVFTSKKNGKNRKKRKKTEKTGPLLWTQSIQTCLMLSSSSCCCYSVLLQPTFAIVVDLFFVFFFFYLFHLSWEGLPLIS